MINKGTTTSIRGINAEFDVPVVFHQGGQELPCLINYYIDYVLKVAASEIDVQFRDGWAVESKFTIHHLYTNCKQHQVGKMNGVPSINTSYTETM